MKHPFMPEEDRILSAMYSANRAISVPELSQQTGFSIVTVDKYIRSLERKRCVIGKRIGKIVYWRILEEGIRHQMLQRLPSPKKRFRGE